jgi:hypothetical protein
MSRDILAQKPSSSLRQTHPHSINDPSIYSPKLTIENIREERSREENDSAIMIENNVSNTVESQTRPTLENNETQLDLMWNEREPNIPALILSNPPSSTKKSLTFRNKSNFNFHKPSPALSRDSEKLDNVLELELALHELNQISQLNQLNQNTHLWNKNSGSSSTRNVAVLNKLQSTKSRNQDIYINTSNRSFKYFTTDEILGGINDKFSQIKQQTPGLGFTLESQATFKRNQNNSCFTEGDEVMWGSCRPSRIQKSSMGDTFFREAKNALKDSDDAKSLKKRIPTKVNSNVKNASISKPNAEGKSKTKVSLHNFIYSDPNDTLSRKEMQSNSDLRMHEIGVPFGNSSNQNQKDTKNKPNKNTKGKTDQKSFDEFDSF